MKITQQHLYKCAREWLLEVFPSWHDAGTIEELSYDECIRSINKYYTGGVIQFISDMQDQ